MTQNNKLLKVMTSKSSKLMEEILVSTHERRLWVSTLQFRQSFCETTNISEPTYFRYLNMLVSAGLISPLNDRGVYNINVEVVEMYRSIKQTVE